MSQNNVDEQIDKALFRMDDEWTKKDEQAKVKALNQVFRKNAMRLERARQNMAKLDDPSISDEGVIGWLYWNAFEMVNSAANEEKVKRRGSDPENFEELAREFVETVDPIKMKHLSRKAQKIGRMPAELRTILDENGTKIYSMISFAYSGTEVVREGSSDSSDPMLAD